MSLVVQFFGTQCIRRLLQGFSGAVQYTVNQLQLKKLECGPMPDVMAALSNIGGAFCWTPQSLADTTTRVPCGNAANICTLQNSVRGQEPLKCIYSAPVQETAKHRVKFGWPPLSDVGAVTKPRRETRWNFLGCPKLANRSQPLVNRRSPYSENLWRYCCLTSFFPIVDTCLNCEDIARQSCAMVCRRWIFGDFLRPAFPASRVQHVSDLHSKFALRPRHL